jgi:hypothetical protein
MEMESRNFHTLLALPARARTKVPKRFLAIPDMMLTLR